MVSKEDIIKTFDPNSVGVSGKLFGLPFGVDHSEIIIIPVPWEVTVSYRSGTAKGPQSVIDASLQVDLFTFDVADAWKLGVCCDEFNADLIKLNKQNRILANKYIRSLESLSADKELDNIPVKVNKACEEMIQFVRERSRYYLNQSKIVAVLGGDHSTPLGLIQELASIYDSFGILQIDAHCDLRKKYEDFTYSHASIMFNVLQLSNVKKLVQIGIRDYCQEESDLINGSDGRVKTFLYSKMKEEIFGGLTFDNYADKIIQELPEKVYISFDIDGLDPSLSPHTGTPVPGGLSFDEARYLVKKIATSGRKIIGFDLCEVSPSEDKNNQYDANVGARVLYNLINFTGVSQRLLSLGSF